MRTIPQFLGLDGVFFLSSAVWHTHIDTPSYSTIYRPTCRRVWLAIPAITMVLLRVLKYVTRYVCEVTRYVIHVTRNLNYVTRFLS